MTIRFYHNHKTILIVKLTNPIYYHDPMLVALKYIYSYFVKIDLWINEHIKIINIIINYRRPLIIGHMWILESKFIYNRCDFALQRIVVLLWAHALFPQTIIHAWKHIENTINEID